VCDALATIRRSGASLVPMAMVFVRHVVMGMREGRMTMRMGVRLAHGI